MLAVQSLLLVLLPSAVALAWLRGGRPERTAAAALLTAWCLGFALADWRLGRISVGTAAADLGLLVVLGLLALRHDRWWLLAASAAQALVVAAHLAVITRPGLTLDENAMVLCVFRCLVAVCLLAGAPERWLAGETHAAPGLVRRDASYPPVGA
jgi:hypothetical protein